MLLLGLGLYALSSEAASKTLESDTGINKLLQATDPIPQFLQTFLNIINIAGKSHYPGSPFIIKQLLRPNDTHNMDAYNAIKVLLPFKENRGLIFLDPPFKVKNEFQKLLEALKKN